MNLSRKIRHGASVAILIAVLIPRLAVAGAWTQGRGHFYLRTSLNRYFSDSEFDVSGDRHSFRLDGEFEDRNLANYVEYGITDRFTAVASFAVKSLRIENKVRLVETRGVGDVDLALRTKLLSGSAGVASIQLLAKIPSAYDVDVSLPLGNGEREFDTHLLYGRSLSPLLPGYCGLEVGYRWRAGVPANEFRYLAEFGSSLGAGFYFRTKLDGVRGQRIQSDLDDSGNPTVRNSSDLGVLDLTAGRSFGSHLSVEAGFSPALYGRTTTSGSTLSLAVAYAGQFGGHHGSTQ